MNSRELSKSDHEDMSESLRGHHEQGPVIGDINRRFSKDKMADGRTFRKASLAVRTNIVTEVRNEISNSPKPAAMSCRLKTENSSVGCCVISSVKSPKMGVKTTTESHRKAANHRSSLRCADRRRGSDPGLNMQVKCLNSEVSPNLCLPPQSLWTGESTRSSARSRKGACDYVNLREMFLANGVMTTPDMESCRSATSHPYDQCQTADSRRHWLSFNDRRSNPGPDLCSSPSAVPNRRLQGSQGSLRHDPQECCVDSHALRRSFRKSRNSSRKEWSASRDTVSEFGIESSVPLSPLLKRRSSRRKTSTKSREVQQTTNAKDSGEVSAATDKNQVLDTCKKPKQGTDNAGCHATTQTEWHNGWETVPSGYLPVFRARIQQLPQNSNPLSASKDVRDSGCSTPEHQILNDIPLHTMRYAQELPMGKPPLFDLPPDTSSRLSSERSSATGWGSMDNLGFLSSGDSSDQTRATASASSSKPRPRAKDDWALYRSPRSEENQHAALPRYQSDTSLDREMAQLSQEMASIQMECEVLVSRHINERLKVVGNQGTSTNAPAFLFPQSSSSHHQPSKDEGPSHPSFTDQATHMILNQNQATAEMQSEAGSVHDWINTSAYEHLERLESEKSSSDHEIEEEESKDSSSAYNTGESSGSTAMGQAGSNTSGEFQKSLMTLITDKMGKGNQDDEEPKEDGCVYCEKLKEASCQCSEEGKNVDSGDAKADSGPNKGVSDDTDDVFHPSFSPGTIMYTNEAHLQHTIFLQQQLLRRALTMSGHGDLECQSSISLHKELVSSHCLSGQEEDSSTSKTPETEWRVKRRPDGTRYITRRPSRTKILKERALRISEERRGLTTDEDATSEMKLGRYWSREERKRHLERARERRKKEGNVGRSKLAVVKEGRLSLVVVQEEETLVSPGSRKSNSSGKYLPLYPALTKVNHYTKLARTSAILSVTTV